MNLRLVISLGFAALLYVFFLAEERNAPGAVWFAILVFPFSVGFSTQVLIDPRVEWSRGRMYLTSFAVMLFLLVGLMAVGYESLLCVAIALPITLPIQYFGVTTARKAFRPFDADSSTALRSSLLAIPIALMLWEPNPTLPQRDFTVVNEIQINAPAARVWQEIAQFPQVQKDERLWTISHNILNAPVPQHSAISDGVRHAVWSQDVVYDEVLTSQDAQHMAWDIRFAQAFRTHDHFQRILPNSSQFTLLRGRYDLSETGGMTTLTLRTDYRLQTAMNLYISWWGQLFLGDNHRSILHVLKRRSETQL